ncbi:hypothetical protein [Sutcliffiella horikoshii]|uniref:hypothetical protein n=1 Tax=Sutcliffiella horikoshii TaxID=79883 RepID=UPI003CFB3280
MLLRYISLVVLVVFVGLCSACFSNNTETENNLISYVKETFEENEINLNEIARNSGTFHYTSSNVIVFSSEGGNIHLIYNIKDEKTLGENIKRTLSEAEFNYEPIIGKYENYQIIYIPNNDLSESVLKVKEVLEKLN